MDQRVRDRILAGQIQVVISGHTSHLGEPAFNLTLSEKRAKHIEQMVRGFGGAFANVNTFFFGEVLAGGGPNDNSGAFRSGTTRACGQLQGADAAAGPIQDPAENDNTVCPGAGEAVGDSPGGEFADIEFA
jgi:hypothetical protein